MEPEDGAPSTGSIFAHSHLVTHDWRGVHNDWQAEVRNGMPDRQGKYDTQQNRLFFRDEIWNT